MNHVVPRGKVANLLPKLRAYSGLRLPEAKSDFTRTLGRAGSLEVKLAGKAHEVRSAQRLRYNVFYKEMSAIPAAATLLARRDVDAFDTICDHLNVVDHDWPRLVFGLKRPRVVGTYRLLRQEIAQHHGGFYTQNEFDVGALMARHRNQRFLELGRSCVLPQYRNKRTVELLWHGISNYVAQHRLDVLIGCASLEGTNPDKLATQLSFLHHFARAPEQWRATAVPSRRVDMNRMPKEAIDAKAALRELPPLVKGYLRLGAYIGDGAVVDHQFGTTDVLIVLPMQNITARYRDKFVGGDEQKIAA
ncbi:MAG: GNAT family N-acetyltransferase [Xanthobacteraceae bacterium]|nr:GNAT family N-acetyltransferase [Xanthobacteraceae bacterium]MBX3524209.1 GNAT family N-acetyltransferase [Xanthobacteraceae bacterium]MBX3534891.1 GNAT family N-acetyltransferase [Xanthobacteraceae bacterium]MCW5673241.1 GNAT family N-acetyltransferase [Xanthobacteraceae bacterium]MCW5677646.1 GNAT family N-acetyltransferase [Xanthobacteraceae bacterium]